MGAVYNLRHSFQFKNRLQSFHFIIVRWEQGCSTIIIRFFFKYFGRYLVVLATGDGLNLTGLIALHSKSGNI